jgi:hypothetical protein
MSFTPEERRVVTAGLQSYGWQMQDGILWSPSGGLYFNDAHFAHWSPLEMSEVFDRRGDRIEAQHPTQEAVIAEHHQVRRAIATLRRTGRCT